MTRRILYIAPVKGGDYVTDDDWLAEYVTPGVELHRVALPRGPRHVEYHYYESLVMPDMLHLIMQAEEAGYDAAVISCFYDLGLQEAREITRRMIVTAPCEASCLIAGTLGHKFSIIVGRRKWIPQMADTVTRYGMKDRLASFRPVELGVLDFHRDEAETARRFREVGRLAVEHDGAEVIILGCTAARGFYADLQRELGVPVIDASLAALKFAEFAVELRDRFGWQPSKVGGYEAPPAEELNTWRLDEQYDFAHVKLAQGTR